MTSVLITGVSGDLGTQLATHFLHKGCHVVGLDIRQPEGIEAEFGAQFEFRACDLRCPDQIETVLSGGEPADIVINNAGVIHSAPLIRLVDGKLTCYDFERWREVIDVTLSAVFYVSAYCAAAMVSRSRKGLIVNISSICAAGNLGQPAYSAAKAGVNGLTVALAKELGPLGVRVAALAPGFIDTASTRKAVGEPTLKQIRGRTALRRLGKVEEFLKAIDFIVENAFFDGKILELDGGLSL
ncbi:MAG: SDR family NAD(P)-dependent oxidoreductase [Pirellulaceae bacterium]